MLKPLGLQREKETQWNSRMTSQGVGRDRPLAEDSGEGRWAGAREGVGNERDSRAGGTKEKGWGGNGVKDAMGPVEGGSWLRLGQSTEGKGQGKPHLVSPPGPSQLPQSQPSQEVPVSETQGKLSKLPLSPLSL